MTDTTIALVTGANKGIGYEIAGQLATGGATVLLAARDPQLGKAAAASLGDLDVHPLTLDVTDPASIADAARWIEDTYGRLDILVNNAGIARDAGRLPSALPLDVLRETYETNVFGLVAVTNALVPLLRRAPAARIVNLSSSLGSLTIAGGPEPPWGRLISLAYPSSKTAVNALTVQYALELRDTQILVNAADPSYCATDLNGHRGFRTAAQGAAVAVRLATLPAGGPTGQMYGEDGVVPW
jgi:NAD(P)-dependent dehydrogenase (short-subunit alcohol dehydrogenase family)